MLYGDSIQLVLHTNWKSVLILFYSSINDDILSIGEKNKLWKVKSREELLVYLVSIGTLYTYAIHL